MILSKKILGIFQSVLFIGVLLSNVGFASNKIALNYDSSTGTEIDFKVVREIALDEGQYLWGKVAIGPLIPLCDMDGNIYAYDVPYKIGDDKFPTSQEIIDSIDYYKTLILKAEKQDNEELIKKRWGNEDYMTVMIGGRYDVFPILEFHEGLPEYYTRLAEAKEKASKVLESKNPVLERIYYKGYLEKWFMFCSNGKTVYINTYSLKIYESLKKSVDGDNVNDFSDMWTYRYSQVDTLDTIAETKGTTTVTIEGVPFYEWHSGCSPTAAAMVLGYWDNNGYPNLIDGYHSWWNNPDDFIEELAQAMGTNNGSTIPFFIDEGIEEVTSDRGYNFDSQESNIGIYTTIGTTNSHWHYIKNQIDAGHPLVWSVGGYDEPDYGQEEIDHSVAVAGYKKVTESRWYWLHDAWWCYALVHNTWDYQASYWLILKSDELTGTFYYPEYYTDLCTRVTLPGISPPVPEPLYVGINGPISLDDGESGTFYACTYGGSETYTNYKWWRRNDGSGVPPKATGNFETDDIVPKAPPVGFWIHNSCWDGKASITTGASFDFSLKCEVTDSDNNTATDIHSVIVGGFLLSKKQRDNKANINIPPTEVTLSGNYPNPFNPTTSIKFGLPDAMPVEISIYSITGKKVSTLINQELSAGYYQVNWDGTGKSGNKVPSGIYIYTLKAGSKRLTSKMLFAK